MKHLLSLAEVTGAIESLKISFVADSYAGLLLSRDKIRLKVSESLTSFELFPNTSG